MAILLRLGVSSLRFQLANPPCFVDMLSSGDVIKRPLNRVHWGCFAFFLDTHTELLLQKPKLANESDGFLFSNSEGVEGSRAEDGRACGGKVSCIVVSIQLKGR